MSDPLHLVIFFLGFLRDQWAFIISVINRNGYNFTHLDSNSDYLAYKSDDVRDHPICKWCLI